nr:hypothetical protein [Pseudomonas zanjanensis]
MISRSFTTKLDQLWVAECE